MITTVNIKANDNMDPPAAAAPALPALAPKALASAAHSAGAYANRKPLEKAWMG